MVQLRKQVHAARAEASSVRVQLAQAESERYPAGALWSVGLLGLFASAAWVLERRRRLQDETRGLDEPSTLPAAAVAFPDAVEPAGVSVLDGADLSRYGDEADAWISQAKLALPETR